MNRNRHNYQCDVVLTNDGTTNPNAEIPSSNVLQIHRVQDGSYSYSITEEDVNQWGQVGRIGTVSLSSPQVTADFTYLLSDLSNEEALGFHLSNDFSKSFTKNLLSVNGSPIAPAVKSGRNFYLLTCEEGSDANIGGFATGSTAFAVNIGKAYLTDYSLEASVGSIPQVSFSVQGSAQLSQVLTVPSGQELLLDNPFIDESGEATTQTTVDVSSSSAVLTPHTGGLIPAALRPGDIMLELGDSAILNDLTTAGGEFSTKAHIQSFSLNIPLSRTPLEKLGNNFSYAEEVDFPVQVTVNISAIVSELKNGSIFDRICSDDTHDLAVTFRRPCGGTTVAKFLVKGAKIQNENFSQSIGSNKTVDMTFIAQIGGPEDLNAGVFVSGDSL